MKQVSAAGPAALPPRPPPISRMRRLHAALSAYGVQVILFSLWLSMAWLLYAGLIVPVMGHSPQWFEEFRGLLWNRVLGKPPSPAHAPGTQGAALTDVALAVAVMGLCLLPKVLTFCLALLLNQLGVDQLRYRLCPAADTPDPGCAARVLSDWDHEQQRSRAGLLRMTQHAGLFGLIASAALTTCALLLYGRPGAGLRHAAAFTVVSAVALSFIVHLSRILLRAAHRDASARMFAWATRGELLAILGAVLLVALMRQPREPVIASPEGFLLAGGVVALFGERVLASIADRAVRVLGLPDVPRRGVEDLPGVGGLSEADLQRLAEEGIETLHGLAYASTARLFFTTPYSLQRLCSWQDEALLQLHLGARAQALREQLHIRGALAALRLAERLASDGSDAKELEDIVRGLGFAGLGQARLALAALREDEAVWRLRVYASAGVERVVACEPG